MKTLFANNETQNFDSFSFDVLTAEELSLVKGGKSIDVYIPLNGKSIDVYIPVSGKSIDVYIPLN